MPARARPNVKPLAETRRRLGRITFDTIDDPPVLVVTPHGYVGPRLVRDDLRVAREHAATQPGPWWYVVDPTDAIPNPVNLVFLRAVSRLPGVAGYYVVARRQPLRAISRLLVAIGGPHAVFASMADAMDRIRSDQRRR